MLDKLAMQLFLETYQPTHSLPFDQMPKGTQRNFRRLARFCLKRELEARKEEIQRVMDLPLGTTTQVPEITDRFDLISAQIKELG